MFRLLALSFGNIAGRAAGRRQQQDCRAGQPDHAALHTRVSLFLQQGGFEPNTARLFAEALAEDQVFTRQLFAAHMAKLTREIRLLRVAWWWSAGVILAGIAVLELLFRLH